MNFPTNPTDQQTYSSNGKTYIYIANKGYWKSKVNYTIPPLTEAQLALYKISLAR